MWEFFFLRFSQALSAWVFISAHYTSEVFRAGIENVPKGQWDAARALNYSPVQT